jgi:hypothetical protein
MCKERINPMKNVNELITDLRNTPVPKGLAKSLIDVLSMP